MCLVWSQITQTIEENEGRRAFVLINYAVFVFLFLSFKRFGINKETKLKESQLQNDV